MTDCASGPVVVPVTLKWNKQTYTNLFIQVGESASSFQERVETETGVPVSRQKLLAKGYWKGSLPKDSVLDESVVVVLNKNNPKAMAVTLIGSADKLSQKPQQETKFLEDLTKQDLEAAEEALRQAAMGNAQGMIPAIQLEPHHREDGKKETYEYNRMVTGLPQEQIEQELRKQQTTTNEDGTSSSYGKLQGRVVMTLGLELRRAYVNDLAVLEDGTCVSVLEDGHVQLWKNASQLHDVIHPGGGGGGEDDGINSVVSLPPYGFATAGRGYLQLWTSDADPILTVPSVLPGTTPASLVRVHLEEDDETITCLASRFQITRQSNPFQFRLPPQNETERLRRAQAEAHEEAIQQALDKASRNIQIWYSVQQQRTDRNQRPLQLQSQILEPPSTESAPVTCLTSLSLGRRHHRTLLVAGDAAGCLRFWSLTRGSSTVALQVEHLGLFQFNPSCSVICLESLSHGRLAVSTDSSRHNQQFHNSYTTHISVSNPRAVHIVHVHQILAATTAAINSSNPSGSVPIILTSLTGHTKDAVHCMCQLPNGDLLTGGGKMDATLQLWSHSQLEDGAAVVIAKPHLILDQQVGYVFALAVLHDLKPNSYYYAVAAARYNSLKIIL